MAGDFSSILSALQNGVTAVHSLGQQVRLSFPRMGAATNTPPPSVGTISFTSSLATGFLAVTTSSGATVYIPTYPSS